MILARYARGDGIPRNRFKAQGSIKQLPCGGLASYSPLPPSTRLSAHVAPLQGVHAHGFRLQFHGRAGECVPSVCRVILGLVDNRAVFPTTEHGEPCRWLIANYS